MPCTFAKSDKDMLASRRSTGGDFAPQDRASGPGQAGYNRHDPAGFRPRSSGPRPTIEGSPS